MKSLKVSFLIAILLFSLAMGILFISYRAINNNNYTVFSVFKGSSSSEPTRKTIFSSKASENISYEFYIPWVMPNAGFDSYGINVQLVAVYNNTTVRIDLDGDSVFDNTYKINETDFLSIPNVAEGAYIVADKPIYGILCSKADDWGVFDDASMYYALIPKLSLDNEYVLFPYFNYHIVSTEDNNDISIWNLKTGELILTVSLNKSDTYSIDTSITNVTIKINATQKIFVIGERHSDDFRGDTIAFSVLPTNMWLSKYYVPDPPLPYSYDSATDETSVAIVAPHKMTLYIDYDNDGISDNTYLLDAGDYYNFSLPSGSSILANISFPALYYHRIYALDPWDGYRYYSAGVMLGNTIIGNFSWYLQTTGTYDFTVSFILTAYHNDTNVCVDLDLDDYADMTYNLNSSDRIHVKREVGDGGITRISVDKFTQIVIGMRDGYSSTSDHVAMANLVLFSVDTNPPVTNYFLEGPNFATYDALYISPETQIHLDSIDDTGISKIFYRIIGVTDWLEYVEPFSLAGLSDGAYTIEYYAVDLFNNYEDVNRVEIYLDGTAPETTALINASGAIKLEAKDLASGVDAIYYRVNESAWEEYQDPIKIENGTYVIEYYAVDNLGNREHTKRIIVVSKREEFMYVATINTTTITTTVNLAPPITNGILYLIMGIIIGVFASYLITKRKSTEGHI